MSGLDATFLYGETGGMHMHVVGAMVFDPSTSDEPYSFEAIKELVATRMARMPQFRQKLAVVPLRLHHPVWADDEEFDLDFHVRRIGCPSPGSMEDFGQVVADIASRRLDRAHPLWQMWVVEGLEGGLVGVVLKMHHSATDGVSGANLMAHLFDLEPHPAPAAEDDITWDPAHKPNDLALVGYALTEWARHPVRFVKVLPSTVKGISSLVMTIRRRSGGAGGMPIPLTAPKTVWNGPITAHRSVAFVDVPLVDLKAIKNAFGTTLNDVVLAVSAGALREFLAKRGELPESALQASVPVSTHGEEAATRGVNQISSMFVSLETQIDDPVERLRIISARTVNAKAEHRAVGAKLLQEWAEFAAPLTFSLAARLYANPAVSGRVTPSNLVISNVPGPSFPLYFAGARMLRFYPLGPVLDAMGLNLTVLSLLDNVGFGFIACRELLSAAELKDLAACVPAAVAELLDAAQSAA